jgi:hypothetical protein
MLKIKKEYYCSTTFGIDPKWRINDLHYSKYSKPKFLKIIPSLPDYGELSITFLRIE